MAALTPPPTWLVLPKAGVAGKAGGAPGNAFALVYGSKTIKVYENLYKVEPVLSEWIRWGPPTQIQALNFKSDPRLRLLQA